MIKLLEKLPVTECPKFLHRVVDGVCGRDPPRFGDYGNVWSLTEWMEILDGLSSFFRFAVGKKCSDEEVQESLADLGGGHREAVLACLKGRGEELRQALVERTNAVSSAQLQDFDWQIKLALSSHKSGPGPATVSVMITVLPRGGFEIERILVGDGARLG
ncbi:hypothetical protein ANANG_G00096260 [Anguilla anguilla]|uniref:COMMD8 helical N-terminal domain-containing protein n=1 Tax=Anguilla anguilla TaxID=7936 RepID=A0A9D3S2V4_ANGAN|nr:hypothetical protein ANANG_G00096260 [Anguilla anguilla]